MNVFRCVLGFAPFLLIVFGPLVAIRFVRPTLARWSLRVLWFSQAMWLTLIVVTAVVGGVGGVLAARQNPRNSEILLATIPNSNQKNSAPSAALLSSGVAPPQYLQKIYKIALFELNNSIEPELVMGLIQQESGWNPNALSSLGAMGLTQLMPGTAADMGVADPYDPDENIRGGMKYLAWLLQRYNGDTRRALWAYHAGPGNLDRRGPTELDRLYADKVLSYREQFRAKASNGQMAKYSVYEKSFGPIYEEAVMTQDLHGREYGHLAIDLGAYPGAPIYAPFDGQVTQRYVDEYDNTVIVLENDYYRVTLLHGDYMLDLAEEFERGDVIGFESNHGYTKSGGILCNGRPGCGEHTHISIYDKEAGHNVDPKQFQLSSR